MGGRDKSDTVTQKAWALRSISELHRSHVDHVSLHETYKRLLETMHAVERRLGGMLKEKVERDQKMVLLKQEIREGKRRLEKRQGALMRANRTNSKLNRKVGKLNTRWNRMWGHVVPPLHPFTA